MLEGEDVRSVEKNLEAIVAECKKRQPDKALLKVHKNFHEICHWILII